MNSNMTVDEQNSIYVGGLPYDADESKLRRVFDIYGAIVSVKIINDRLGGGKCYGFITFTNPRSAVHAINEMDGSAIEGRVVRVNEVNPRGPNAGPTGKYIGRNSERDYDRGGVNRFRERDNHYHHQRYRERSRSRDYERPYNHSRERFIDHDHHNNNDWDRDRDTKQDMSKNNHYHRKNIDTDKSLNGSNLDNHSEREFSSKSSDEHDHDHDKQLHLSNQKLEHLQNEISLLEEIAEKNKHVVSKLNEKSKKLEDALIAAKKVTSYRQMQLAKLHKCYNQVRDYNERLKNSEQELQVLINSTMLEMEYGDGVHGNGNT